MDLELKVQCVPMKGIINKFVCAAARSPLHMTELVTQLNAQDSVPVSELDVNEALQGITCEYRQLLDGRFQATVLDGSLKS